MDVKSLSPNNYALGWVYFRASGHHALSVSNNNSGESSGHETLRFQGAEFVNEEFYFCNIYWRQFGLEEDKSPASLCKLILWTFPTLSSVSYSDTQHICSSNFNLGETFTFEYRQVWGKINIFPRQGSINEAWFQIGLQHEDDGLITEQMQKTVLQGP